MRIARPPVEGMCGTVPLYGREPRYAKSNFFAPSYPHFLSIYFPTSPKPPPPIIDVASFSAPAMLNSPLNAIPFVCLIVSSAWHLVLRTLVFVVVTVLPRESSSSSTFVSSQSTRPSSRAEPALDRRSLATRISPALEDDFDGKNKSGKAAAAAALARAAGMANLPSGNKGGKGGGNDDFGPDALVGDVGAVLQAAAAAAAAGDKSNRRSGHGSHDFGGEDTANDDISATASANRRGSAVKPSISDQFAARTEDGSRCGRCCASG